MTKWSNYTRYYTKSFTLLSLEMAKSKVKAQLKEEGDNFSSRSNPIKEKTKELIRKIIEENNELFKN